MQFNHWISNENKTIISYPILFDHKRGIYSNDKLNGVCFISQLHLIQVELLLLVKPAAAQSCTKSEAAIWIYLCGYMNIMTGMQILLTVQRFYTSFTHPGEYVLNDSS